MRRWLRFIFAPPSAIMISLLFSGACASADIHQWRDKDGITHFGDNPPVDVRAETVTVKPNVYQSPSIETLSGPFPQKERVILYSASWCGYCRKARSYFRARGIPFTEYDVEKSEQGKRDYKRLGARGIPIIVVGKKRLNGFSEETFEKIYHSR